MSDGQPQVWRCTVCGYVHHGPHPPDKCPVCGADSDLFEPVEKRPASTVLPKRPGASEVLDFLARVN